MGKATQMIKQAIIYDETDAENWIVWGLIMRTVGNYTSAKHKYERALKCDPNNQMAKTELEILFVIMKLDELIDLDKVPAIAHARAVVNK